MIRKAIIVASHRNSWSMQQKPIYRLYYVECPKMSKQTIILCANGVIHSNILVTVLCMMQTIHKQKEAQEDEQIKNENAKERREGEESPSSTFRMELT